MKKTLLIAALALAATPAMASKARLNALASSPHLEDIQDVLTNPAELQTHGDWLTFEMGGNTTAAAPGAEGGFSRGMGDAKYGFYLGHQEDWANEVRDAGYLGDENPLDLFYSAKSGDMAWGVGLHYSNSDKKSTQEKQNVTGIKVGATGKDWEADLALGLANTYKNEATNLDFKGKTAIALNGLYQVETLSYTAGYSMNGGKEETAGATTRDVTTSALGLGVVNSTKSEGADFFYGVSYVMATQEDKAGAGSKVETTQLPVLIGLEADAASWMVLRASVTQNVLLGSTKTTAGGVGESDTIGNNTVVAAGAGFKFNKLQLDATLKGSTTGDLNGNTLLGNASLTYLF